MLSLKHSAPGPSPLPPPPNLRHHAAAAAMRPFYLVCSHLRRSPIFSISRRFPSISPPHSTPSRSFLDLPMVAQTSSPSLSSRVLTPSTVHPPGEGDTGEDDPMNEFLSRFVWTIRGKITEAFPSLPKPTLEAMLLVICQKVVARLDGYAPSAADDLPGIDLSEDLWATIWEVSNSVHEAMRRDRMREQLKQYLHCDEVKEMCRFAADVGIRGPMLRELRFKWARENLEGVEFYRGLDRMLEEGRKKEEVLKLGTGNSADEETGGAVKLTSLPQRKGRIKYKIYGLDLSDPMWAEVSEKVEEAERHFVPEEPQQVEGKCRKVEEQLLALNPKKDDPLQLLSQWADLLKPKKVDWLALLERIKERNIDLYFKVSEFVLSEESFGTNIRDYSKLIDAYYKADRLQDVEKILQKMTESGIAPDVIISIILVHMYSKAGDLDRTKEAFESLKLASFKPDLKLFTAMITAYVNSGLPKQGETLIREMESSDIKPTKEIYMQIMKAFAERGDVDGAQRIMNTMQFSGIQPTSESHTLLVEAFGLKDDPDNARIQFDNMMQSGHNPDDRCIASMIAAYKKKNHLDKALGLLLTVEKDGYKPGTLTNTVLVDWFSRLKLVEEAEMLSTKLSEKGETPFDIHVGLCDMYARVGHEEKLRRSLKILEARKELLRKDQFERVISGLLAGGYIADAKRIYNQMQAKGFTSSDPNSDPIKVALMAAQSISGQKSIKKWGRFDKSSR